MKPSPSYSKASARPRSSGGRAAKRRHLHVDVSSRAPEPHVPKAGIRRPPPKPAHEQHASRPMRIPCNRDYTPADLALAERMFRLVQNGPPIRTEKVERVRAALAAGAYEEAYDTELALEVVAERLLDDLML